MSFFYLKISVVAPPICRLFVISWDYFLFFDRLTRHRHLENESICMLVYHVSFLGGLLR